MNTAQTNHDHPTTDMSPQTRVEPPLRKSTRVRKVVNYKEPQIDLGDLLDEPTTDPSSSPDQPEINTSSIHNPIETLSCQIHHQTEKTSGLDIPVTEKQSEDTQTKTNTVRRQRKQVLSVNSKSLLSDLNELHQKTEQTAIIDTSETDKLSEDSQIKTNTTHRPKKPKPASIEQEKPTDSTTAKRTRLVSNDTLIQSERHQKPLVDKKRRSLYQHTPNQSKTNISILDQKKMATRLDPSETITHDKTTRPKSIKTDKRKTTDLEDENIQSQPEIKSNTNSKKKTKSVSQMNLNEPKRIISKAGPIKPSQSESNQSKPNLDLEEIYQHLLINKSSDLVDTNLKDLIPKIIESLSAEENQELAQLLPYTDRLGRDPTHAKIDPDSMKASNNFFWEATEKWQDILYMGGFDPGVQADRKEKIEPDDSFKDENYETYWGERVERDRALKESRQKKGRGRGRGCGRGKGRGRGNIGGA